MKYIIFIFCLFFCVNIFSQTQVGKGNTQINNYGYSPKEMKAELNELRNELKEIKDGQKKRDNELKQMKDSVTKLENEKKLQTQKAIVKIDSIQQVSNLRENKLQERINTLENLLNTRTAKLDYVPFGIAQFEYGKTGKGTLFAALQSVTLLGGGIGAVICFKKYNDYGKYAKIEQDDDKIGDYLRKQENNLWGGIGCLASIVAVYGVNVICNKADRKDFLKVSAYSTPQSTGLTMSFNF